MEQHIHRPRDERAPCSLPVQWTQPQQVGMRRTPAEECCEEKHDGQQDVQPTFHEERFRRVGQYLPDGLAVVNGIVELESRRL